MNTYISETPPRCAGSYRIRDADGFIIFWGDSDNLYDTWFDLMGNKSDVHSNWFEYAL